MFGEMDGKRPYTLKRRAERQEETRARIVDAAIALHSTLGPARSPLSQVAERAGVQRNTFYAHFPDERSLLLACSATSLGRDPPPDPEPWAAIPAAEERLRTGLGALYAWYDRNEGMAGCVLRDAEFHAPTREIVALRLAPGMMRLAAVLGAGLRPAQGAMLGLAIDFHTWRTLVRQGGLTPAQAAGQMARAIAGAPDAT